MRRSGLAHHIIFANFQFRMSQKPKELQTCGCGVKNAGWFNREHRLLTAAGRSEPVCGELLIFGTNQQFATQVRRAGPAAATRTRCAKSHATQALESCAPAPAPGAAARVSIEPGYNPAGGGEGAASRTSRDSTLHFGAQRAAFSGDQASDQSVGFFLSALIVLFADELLDRIAGGPR